MKKRILFYFVLGILFSLAGFSQASYAYELPLITIERIDGYTPYSIEEDGDKLYLKLDLDNRQLNNQIYDTGFYFGVVRIKTLYDTFVVTNETNQIIKIFNDFEYIEIDSLNTRDDGLVIFSSDTDSFAWDTNQIGAVYAYILKDIKYDPAGEGLVFATDIDLQKPVEEFNQYFVGWDNYDGVVEIEVADDQYSDNRNQLGTYDVTLVLTDSSNNKAFLTYQIEVKDLAAPIIVEQDTIDISYTEEFDIEDFINHLEITDNVSARDHLSLEVIEDQYTMNKLSLGTYDIKIAVNDESANQTIYTQKIRVIDDVSPIISGTLVYTKQAEEILSVQTMINNLIIKDDYTQNPYVTIIVDDYSLDMHKLGTYNIDIKATDNSGNTSYATITVHVVDEVSPVFFLNLGMIQLSGQNMISPRDLRKLIEDKLPVTYDYFDIVLDEYTQNAYKPGIYRVNLNVYQNDKTHNFQLLIRVNEEVDIPITDPKNDADYGDWLLYSLSISGVVITTGAIFFFLRKKRSV